MKDDKVSTKVCQKTWQLITHIGATIICYLIFKNNDFFRNSNNTIFHPLKLPQPPSDIIYLYIYLIAIWVYSTVKHVFFEHRRADYYVLLMHHAITISLMVGSYEYHFTKIGMFILFIHESSDIIVESLKISNYLKLNGKKSYYLSETLLVTNIITWFIIRNYMFIKFLYDMYYTVGTNEVTFGSNFFARIYNIPGFLVLSLLLDSLEVLHIYWIILFIKLAYTVVKSGIADASELYEQDGKKTKKNN
uniref:Sphingosine N-acyltransferase Lag1 n=1 Tax=Opalinidae sp. TaxID=2059444 RepID=A0A649UYX1_9STRA|nr:sphingosine N-acyltransferase Lag1 [Opalinidae sp.]